MTDSAERERILRGELKAVLAEHSDGLRAQMRNVLATRIQLDGGQRLQFEVDPWYWGIHCCATEEPVTPGEDWLRRALAEDWFERAGEDVNWDQLIADELCSWFAACWREVGGPAKYRPAFLFFHDYHRQQFDLERACWISLEEAFED